MKVQTQTEELRRLRRTNLELIFSDHNAYCLPPCQNKCPSHIDIPGFLKANAEAELARVRAHLQAHDPVPERARSRLPGAVRGALPARRGRRGDRHPRQPPLRRRPGPQVDARRGHRSAACRSSSSRQTGRRAAVIGSGPAGHGRRLLPAAIAGPRRDRLRARPGARRHAPLRHPAVPPAQGRGPRGRVRDRSPGSAGGSSATQGLGARLHARRPARTRASTPSVIAIGCYDTNKLGIPGEDADGVLDGLEYLRTATLGLPYPGHAGKRVVVIGGGFTSMDCTRTSIRQGAERGHPRLPPRHEGHAGVERGPRGDRGRRRPPSSRRVPCASSPTTKGKVTGVEFIRMELGAPDASGRRRPEPSPGTEFIDPVRPRAAGHRPGSRPDLDRPWRRTASRPTKQRRLKADAVTFATGRPGVFGTGDVRIGAATVVEAIAEGRRSRLRRRRLPQGPGPGRHPHPPDAGRAAARVPLDRAVHQRGQGAALPPDRRIEAEERNQSYIEYEIPYTRAGAIAESTRCLQCTCEAIGFCDLRRLGIEYGTTLPDARARHHRAPATGA